MTANTPEFKNIGQIHRDKLVSLFHGREDEARTFWEEVRETIAEFVRLGVGVDLNTVRSNEMPPSALKARMKTIYNSARSLNNALDEYACSRLESPPNRPPCTGLEMEVRQEKLRMLKLFLTELAIDSDPDARWGEHSGISWRLDYLLASMVQTEVECSTLKLSAVALTQIVFTIADIPTDAKDAIKGANRTIG